ncbi:MAG: ATP-grasp fold amidoligase family protein [Bacilli bacterium]
MYKNVFFFLPDSVYLKWRFKLIMGYKLDLDNPQTFNEKLQWLKLYDRDPKYTQMVDKYEVRKYIKEKIGEEYLIPLLGVYDKFEDIDFDKLPNQFVIKCNHDSGGLVICKDKSKLDIESARRKINSSLKRNYYYSGREWPYKNVKPKIIIEKYMEDNIDKELIDYKLYAFNGRVDYVMVCFDRFNGGTKFIYFDREWNIQKDFSNDGIKYGDNISLRKPKNLDKMFNFASILSKRIPFVRVDFYEVNGKLYFGELTFYPSSGFDDTRPEKISKYLNKILGDVHENIRICNK